MSATTTKARDVARGKWHGILGQWLHERVLAGKHGPCPMCGGKDRFRLDDKDGCGTWICSNCGAGDGFHLLQQINGWTFAEAAKHAEDVCGRIRAIPPKPERCAEEIRQALRSAWGGAKAVTEGDPVSLYLQRRCGVGMPPSCLRFHPGLPYRHDDGSTTKHPAMLAQVLADDGTAVTIHRTYLTDDGQKADLPVVRKLMTPTRKLEAAAVRLAHATDWLGVAEGIETALCASALHQGLPVWSCLNAGLLANFQPPTGVQMLVIFADNDYTFTGQAAAYALAKAVSARGIECRVSTPEEPGTDWADAYRKREAMRDATE